MTHSAAAWTALLLVTLLLGTGCQTSKPETVSTGFLFPASAGGLKHVLYVPPGYTPAKKWPCIVFLHGRGESGTDGVKQMIQGIGSAVQWNAADWPCLIVMPQKPDANRQWEEYGDGVMAILSDVRRRYSVDDDRVLLTGLSQGGHGTWMLAAKHAGTWAAIAPICGYAKPVRPEEIASKVGNVPVWAFHGLQDDVVPPTGTTAITDQIRAERAGKAGGAELKVSLFEGVNHGSWDRAYRDEGLAAWLMAQRRGTK